MHYIVAAETNKGVSKQINQDGLLVKHAKTFRGEILMAIVCDGMGGLDRGEFASATAIHFFSKWFDTEFRSEIEKMDIDQLSKKWKELLDIINDNLRAFGKKNKIRLGTTFTGILFFEDHYLIAHIGDTRVYKIDTSIHQLTTDHTYVANEIEYGRMTVAQSKTSPMRNMLLQCLGVLETISPEIKIGKIEKAVYLLCSDGFRHKNREEEIKTFFSYNHLHDKKNVTIKIRDFIESARQKEEKDDISAIVIKSEMMGEKWQK